MSRRRKSECQMKWRKMCMVFSINWWRQFEISDASCLSQLFGEDCHAVHDSIKKHVYGEGHQPQPDGKNVCGARKKGDWCPCRRQQKLGLSIFHSMISPSSQAKSKFNSFIIVEILNWSENTSSPSSRFSKRATVPVLTSGKEEKHY